MGGGGLMNGEWAVVRHPSAGSERGVGGKAGGRGRLGEGEGTKEGRKTEIDEYRDG